MTPCGDLQVVWGGRDVEQSYDDLWAFDLSSLEWEEWGRDSPEKPSVRNHLGGFVSNELIFIYGMCLSSAKAPHLLT